MSLTAKQFAAAMRKAPLKVRAAAAQVVTQTALVAESEVRLNLGGRVLQRRSGELARSVRSEQRGSGAKTVVRLIVGGRGVVYARIHEEGGDVEAKRAAYLHFKLPGGQWVRTKRVKIPARPFLAPAADVAQKFMLRRLPVAVADAIKGAE